MSSMPVAPDRTVLVTGATSGIGWETARLLAEQGCRVIVHAPDTESGADALARLIATGIPPSALSLVVADFARLDDVHSMADRVRREHPVLDGLVNNAAIAAPEAHTITGDGVEVTFQVNFLAAYVLTRGLLGPLTARPGGRIVNVSSALHRTASIAWKDLNRSRPYVRLATYAQSQLALTILARAALPAQSECTAVSVHPGICETALRPLYALRGKSPAEGAACVARLCDPATELVPGGYYDRSELADASPVALKEQSARRLLKVADQLVSRAA
jgi:NAD(P)-dependent dehydrogenase (short-subunit alcohol dehydrogenase family)